MDLISKSLLICLAILLLSQHHDTASITKYDQSQHGTYNVQIHLKNLEVIAILDDSMFSGGEQSDIYDYDYTDVSGAFPNGTLLNSSNISLTTISSSSTSPTTPPQTPSTSTAASSSSTPVPPIISTTYNYSSSPSSSPTNSPSSSSPASSSPSTSASSPSGSSSSPSSPSAGTGSSSSSSTSPSSPNSGSSSANSPTGNKPNNRPTTVVNTKVTVRPATSKANATSGGLKPGASQGGSSNKYVNATNSLNVVQPSSATKAPPHNKVSETDQQQLQQVKVSSTTQSSQPGATTAGSTTPYSDGIDYTLMDTLSVPVEIQQPQQSSSQLQSMEQAPSSHLPPMVIRKCAPGYFRDSNGKCRRIRKPHLPFLQMVHTPGVIKSFQGVESSTKKMNPDLAAHSKTSKEEKLVLDLAAKLAKEDPSNVTIKQ